MKQANKAPRKVVKLLDRSDLAVKEIKARPGRIDTATTSTAYCG